MVASKTLKLLRMNKLRIQFIQLKVKVQLSRF